VAEIDRMLEANQQWAQQFPGSKPVRPARKVAVVACMDSRIPLFGVLGLDIGDVDDDVRESMRLVRESPYLLSHEVRGTVYDVTTGLLREVEDPAAPHHSHP